MKNLFILFATLLSITALAKSKVATPTGDWLLTKAVVNTQEQAVNYPVSFTAEGKFMVMDREMGTWKFNKKDKVMTIASKMFKKLDGENRILKSNKEEMVLENPVSHVTFYFKKMDKEKIVKENAASGLMGSWKYVDKDAPDILTIITFQKPDNFSMLTKEPGVQSKSSGTWIFNKKENTLSLIGLRGEDFLSGKSKIISIGKDGVSLENKGESYTLKRMQENKKAIERLTYKSDDFFDADGNFKYENDEEKLPTEWREPSEMLDYLKGIHQLIYRYSVLNEGTTTFNTKTLVAGVNTNEASQSVSIDYIFYGYDKNSASADRELRDNQINVFDNYNRLYPEKEMSFRVTGQETITVPAGTFQCTVIEAVGDFDTNKKLWMINDKPGVFAKMIADKPGDFGSYSVYELQEIK